MSDKQKNPLVYEGESTSHVPSQMDSESQIIDNIVIEANQNTEENQNQQQVIGVRLKQPKSSTQRSRELRARKQLLGQEHSNQHQQTQDDSNIDESISNKKKTSAERTRKWRERKGLLPKRIGERPKPKSVAERSREYRQRKKSTGHQSMIRDTPEEFVFIPVREPPFIKMEPDDPDRVDSIQENFNLGVSKEDLPASHDPSDQAQSAPSNIDSTSVGDSSISTDIVNCTESNSSTRFKQSDQSDENTTGALSENSVLTDASSIKCSEPQSAKNSKRLKQPKSATQRSREFRARQRLLAQERAKQPQLMQDDPAAAAAILEKKRTSAERTRKWRERKGLLPKRIGEKPKPKTAAERSREYRRRKKNESFQSSGDYDNLLSTSSRESHYIKTEPEDHGRTQMIDGFQGNHHFMDVSKDGPSLSHNSLDEARAVHSNVNFMSLADSPVSPDIVNDAESAGFTENDDSDEDPTEALSENHVLMDGSNVKCPEPERTETSKRNFDSGNESNTSTKKHCHVRHFGLFRREDFKEETTWNRFLNVFEDMKRENSSLKRQNELLRDEITTIKVMMKK